MFRKLAKIVAAFAVVAAIGAAVAPGSADAGTRTCYKCVGGWCCY